MLYLFYPTTYIGFFYQKMKYDVTSLEISEYFNNNN